MKKILLVWGTFCVLFCTGQVFALTVTFDSVLDEWIGDDVVNLGTEAAPDGGSYTLLATWDAANLYMGMDRDSSDRYLGDTGWDNDSFFVAIDTDGVAGSGATQDGYGRMNFGGTMLPDFIIYYAGGPNWYESSTWNGSSWDWNGWTDSGAIYGSSDAQPDDEFAISLSNIGGFHEVMVWAWMTRESNGWIEASWPGGPWGEGPTVGNGIMIPEPATVNLLGLGSMLLTSIRRRK